LKRKYDKQILQCEQKNAKKRKESQKRKVEENVESTEDREILDDKTKHGVYRRTSSNDDDIDVANKCFIQRENSPCTPPPKQDPTPPPIIRVRLDQIRLQREKGSMYNEHESPTNLWDLNISPRKRPFPVVVPECPFDSDQLRELNAIDAQLALKEYVESE
jgi:hypothetical protein